MKVDRKRRAGFYWVRFEGLTVVAEWQAKDRYPGIPAGWRMPGAAPRYEDSEVCELLSPRLLPPKDIIRREPPK